METNNSDERKLVIKNFRNIGLTEPAKLVINRSTESGFMGDLVFLVGPNNSGKSNTIDALNAVFSGFKSTDNPEMAPDKKPEVMMLGYEPPADVVEVVEEEVKEIKVKENTEIKFDKLSQIPAMRYLDKDSRDMILKFFENERELFTVLKHHMMHLPVGSFSKNYILASFDTKMDSYDMVRMFDIILQLSSHGNPEYITLTDSDEDLVVDTLCYCSTMPIPGKTTNEKIKNLGKYVKGDLETTKPKTVKKKKKISVPRKNVIGYVPNLHHTQAELTTSIKNPSQLVLNILKSMNYSSTELENMIENYHSMGNQIGILRIHENILNEKLDSINRLFNEMYLSKDSPYSFHMYIVDEDTIQLCIRKGNANLKLDNQSVGFQWFFDFFFNLVLSNELSEGCIVIMDEPATNLHAGSQMELRKVMKEYAKMYQITFVISTHSPFLIDCDYLDELRIIRRADDGETFIENNFQTLYTDDDESRDYSADKMDLILSSLTVGRHVMKDPNANEVFVEGITDYNYLTAFAKLLDVKNISFMPIGGVRNKDLGNKLCGISRQPILLVDADEAGYIAKENIHKQNKAVTVIPLSDIDPGFTGDYDESNFRKKTKDMKGFEIEDLFSEEDRELIIKSRKESDFSSVFKTYIEMFEDKISEETRENFSKVFTYLGQEFMME